MSKRWIWMVGIVCCSMIAGMVVAEAPSWDADAVQGMSRAERLAYQQSFKAQLEDAARQHGWRPGERREFAPAGRQARPPIKALGSITYHSGALGTCCQNSFCVGNQFDTGGGLPVLMSGSVTMATFDMISVGGTAAFVSFFDQQAGTTANAIDSASKGGLATGLNTITWGGGGTTNTYVGSSFLMGVWQFNTDVPAVASGTVGGAGFHGMSINDIVATGFVRPGTFNAAFTATGDILTPVELLNFELE